MEQATNLSWISVSHQPVVAENPFVDREKFPSRLSFCGTMLWQSLWPWPWKRTVFFFGKIRTRLVVVNIMVNIYIYVVV